MDPSSSTINSFSFWLEGAGGWGLGVALFTADISFLTWMKSSIKIKDLVVIPAL
jgi:hypothetical protein